MKTFLGLDWTGYGKKLNWKTWTPKLVLSVSLKRLLPRKAQFWVRMRASRVRFVAADATALADLHRSTQASFLPSFSRFLTPQATSRQEWCLMYSAFVFPLGNCVILRHCIKWRNHSRLRRQERASCSVILCYHCVCEEAHREIRVTMLVLKKGCYPSGFRTVRLTLLRWGPRDFT